MHLYELIQEMPMFHYFSDPEKRQFAEMAHSIIGFKNGDTILAEGEESVSMYLILQGACLVTKRQGDTVIRLSKLKAGEIFGEMAFFTRGVRATDVIAAGEVLVMKMDDDFFRKVGPEVKDKIKSYFIELLIKRLNVMNESIMRTSQLIHYTR